MSSVLLPYSYCYHTCIANGLVAIRYSSDIAQAHTMCVEVPHQYNCAHMLCQLAPCAVSKRVDCDVLSKRRVMHDVTCYQCGCKAKMEEGTPASHDSSATLWANVCFNQSSPSPTLRDLGCLMTECEHQSDNPSRGLRLISRAQDASSRQWRAMSTSGGRDRGRARSLVTITKMHGT